MLFHVSPYKASKKLIGTPILRNQNSERANLKVPKSCFSLETITFILNFVGEDGEFF
jgi:hypothetical protein